MLRKLPVDDGLVEECMNPATRAIRATIDSRRPRLVSQETVPCSESLERDFQTLAAFFTAEPCAVLVRLQDEGTLPAKKDDWLVIVWTPPSVAGPQKVLWGTSTNSLAEAMPQGRIQGLEVSELSRLSWEKFLQAAEGVTGKQRPIFFGANGSNNSARIQLWIAMKEGMDAKIESRYLTQPQVKEPEFLRVNPLGKVPAIRRTDGNCVFESNVIMDYLEDKYSDSLPSFRPDTPEDRQVMNLMIRLHDLYISSANASAPGFTSSLAALYTSTEFHGKARGMDLPTRAAKLAEIWKQLHWLNNNMVGPFLVGSKLTLADLTWYPTAVYIEYMAPKVFGWPDIFRKADGPFPNLAKWSTFISAEEAFPAIAQVRKDILAFWESMEGKGMFKPILTEVAADQTGLKFKYP